MSAAAPGSYIALSHARTDGKQDAADVEEIYNRSPNPMHFRSSPEIAALFGDLTVVDPGVVLMPRWQPELDDDLDRDIDEDYPALAGVGPTGLTMPAAAALGRTADRGPGGGGVGQGHRRHQLHLDEPTCAPRLPGRARRRAAARHGRGPGRSGRVDQGGWCARRRTFHRGRRTAQEPDGAR